METIDIFKQWKDKKTGDSIYKKSFKKVRAYNMDSLFEKKLNFSNSRSLAKMGVGPTCINEFTISALAESFAVFLKNNVKGYKTKGIVLSHDNRKNGKLYLETAVRVFEKHEITCFLFKQTNKQPSPFVSFAVKKINASGGFVITGGKLSGEYNGVKLFKQKGELLSNKESEKIKKHLSSLNPLKITLGKFKYKHLNKHMTKDYLNEVVDLRKRKNDQKLIKVVFSPQNGSANLIGPRILQKMDINYNTVKKEIKTNKQIKVRSSLSLYTKKTFYSAIKLAKKTNADLVILTSSDGNSIGSVYKNSKNKWIFLNSNQIAILIFNHLLKNVKNLRGKIFQSNLSSHLVKAMAKTNNIKIIETKPGFANLMQECYQNNQNTIMVWEDRSNFLLNDKINGDKDAFQAMVLLIELANYLKTQNMTIEDEMKILDHKYGAYISEKQIKKVTSNGAKRLFVQINNLKKIGDDKVVKVVKTSDNPIHASLVKVIFNSGSWMAVEIIDDKFTQEVYFEGYGKTRKDALKSIKKMKSCINEFIEDIKKIG